MRALRTLIGLVLAVTGLPALFVGVAGWSLMRHSDSAGAFSAQIGPVRSTGYAIVVPDVAGLVERHGVASLLGSDRLRVAVRSASAPVVLWIVPATDLGHYLDGVSRTEVTGIGYADGAQPVELSDLPGTAAPAPLASQPFWSRAPSGQSLAWDRATDAGRALLLVRADGLPAFDATLSVTLYPDWLPAASWGSLLGGAIVSGVGILLLFWPVRSKQQLFVVDPERMADFADRIAERLAMAPAPIDPPASPRRDPGRRHDLTGEFVAIPPHEPASYVDSAT
jgi:hypothetical protein